MVQIAVRCKGVSPILMNRIPDTLLEQLRTKTTAPPRLDRTREEVAAEKVYEQDGKPGIPAENLFSCLVHAGKFVKADAKKQISTAASTLLPAFLTIREDFLPFDNGAKWEVDMRRGVHDDKMVPIVRPKFRDWSFSMTIEVDEKQIAEERVRQLFDAAGSKVGLGDFRPARRGPFGRFRVDRWEVNGKK